MSAIALEEAPPAPPATSSAVPVTVMNILFAISLAHLLNDTLQALLPSIYPVLREQYNLTIGQLSWITFTFQCTASVFQPLVGLALDRRPVPHSLAFGMGLTLIGLVALSVAHSFPVFLIAAATIGLGSAIFHPEASRVAYMAAGPRRGFAQSLFQLGGNAGSSFGPLAAATIITARGTGNLAWFTLVALFGVFVLWKVGTWQIQHRSQMAAKKTTAAPHSAVRLSTAKVTMSLAVLVALVFSKYIYLVSLTNFYTFYLIDHFGVSIKTSQVLLFVFLFAIAVGTIIGGPIGDKIGRKRVIWASILGVAPFSLVLPHVGLAATVVLSVFIGVILASAFSAILVYAQELVPGKVGMISGLFFGLAFGFAGIGAALLGNFADHVGIAQVFAICAWLPLIGLLTVLLPDIEPAKKRAQ